MDDLINSLEKFAISKNEQIFQDSLNDIINKMNNSKITHNSDKEWVDLTSNYCKLKYLKDLIKSFKTLPDFFMSPFKVFMESIDSINQYYLREIDWHHSDHDIQEDSLQIQNYLEESISTDDPFYKLNNVLSAYSILIPIIEDIRREKYNESISDTYFLKTFKKRKLN